MFLVLVTMVICAGACGDVFIPQGVHNDVPLDKVLNEWGWEVVFRGNYTTLIGIEFIKQNSGDYLMLAGIKDGSVKVDVLAAALKEDVFQLTNKNVTHQANGAEWYYNGWAMGFAGLGDTIEQKHIDVNGPNERDRLSWHTLNISLPGGGYIDKGSRSGNHLDLYTSRDWDRIIFSIPEDLGTPTDLEIVGLDSIRERDLLKYKATAYFDSGETKDVTFNVTWSVDNTDYATIDPTGELYAAEFSETQTMTLTAEYSVAGVTLQAQKIITIEPYSTSLGKIFWSGYSGDGYIATANLDGSQPEVLMPYLSGARRMDVDAAAGKLYWTSSGHDMVRRSNLDGSHIENLIRISSYGPSDVSVDVKNGKVYWSNGLAKTISWANLDGSNIEEIISDIYHPGKVAIDPVNEKLYWTPGRPEMIGRTNLDGSVVEYISMTGISAISDFAIDYEIGKIYIANGVDNIIQRVNLDGTGLETLVDNDFRSIESIALDFAGNRMYWLDAQDKTIYSADIDGGEPTLIISELQRPIGITVAVEPFIAGTLVDLEIDGPREVTENAGAQYQGVLHFDNARTRKVTVDVTWSIAPAKVGSISENGILLVSGIEFPGEVTVFAEYTLGDITVSAEKVVHYNPVLETYYVDAENGNDDNVGNNINSPFATIQKAIDIAQYKDTINVMDGYYQGEIDFMGKAITVAGMDGSAVIDGLGDYGVSFYSGEGADSVLKNFVVTKSYIGVFIAGSSPTLQNLTIVNNRFGVEAYAGALPAVSNCIFWGNEEDDVFLFEPTYSCVERGANGQGNISADPLFVDFEGQDYHLRSAMGRYWPEIGMWVLDSETSPCIDAGDPTSNPLVEPMPNGGRINMGAYGVTAKASKSIKPWPLAGDLNFDGIVDMADFAIVAGNWLEKTLWY